MKRKELNNICEFGRKMADKNSVIMTNLLEEKSGIVNMMYKDEESINNKNGIIFQVDTNENGEIILNENNDVSKSSKYTTFPSGQQWHTPRPISRSRRARSSSVIDVIGDENTNKLGADGDYTLNDISNILDKDNNQQGISIQNIHESTFKKLHKKASAYDKFTEKWEEGYFNEDKRGSTANITYNIKDSVDDNYYKTIDFYTSIILRILMFIYMLIILVILLIIQNMIHEF